ncbi:MAG: glycosyltransferase family 2 protein [Paludibacter sp.]|nr:glycosyltransferase family 2 protein [Paludibacter sp.]
MPKLSIITINYNNFNGLQKTVESVLSQTSKEFEYIIVDGGSTDGSKELISQYAELNQSIKWVSEKDYGIYHAMNKGIGMADGEYLQFLNSGDSLVSKDVTRNMLAVLKPECNILYGNMLKSLPKGLYRDKSFNGKQPTFLDFYFGTLNHSPAYIRRTLFDKYGLFDENLKIVSDWKWYLNVIVLSKTNINYTNIDVTLFDMTGISTLNNKLDKSERRSVLEEIIPERILMDYTQWGETIIMFERIKKFPVIFSLLNFIDKGLAWIERRNNNNYLK